MLDDIWEWWRLILYDHAHDGQVSLIPIKFLTLMEGSSGCSMSFSIIKYPPKPWRPLPRRGRLMWMRINRIHGFFYIRHWFIILFFRFPGVSFLRATQSQQIVHLAESHIFVKGHIMTNHDFPLTGGEHFFRSLGTQCLMRASILYIYGGDCSFSP